MPRLPRRVVAGVRVVLTVVGLLLLALGTKAAIDGLASREWDAVSGSWVAGDEGGYRYRVADGEYTGERGRFGATRPLSAARADITAKMAEDGVVATAGPMVHYDPSNPSESVLEPGLQRSALLFAGCGVLLLLLAAFPLGASRRPPAERSFRAEGLIPPTFQPSDPGEEQGWSGRKDLDGGRPYWRSNYDDNC